MDKRWNHELNELLQEQLEPSSELSPAWREEIRRRSRELEQGIAGLHSAEEVFAKAYKALE